MLPETFKRLTRLAILGPGLLGLGVAAAGCSDDRPRAGSIDVGAATKAAEARKGGALDFGPRSADVDPVRTRGKGTAGPVRKPRAESKF